MISDEETVNMTYFLDSLKVLAGMSLTLALNSMDSTSFWRRYILTGLQSI